MQGRLDGDPSLGESERAWTGSGEAVGYNVMKSQL